jgi:hypothetical protein
MAARFFCEQEVRDDRLQDLGLERPALGTIRAFRTRGAYVVVGWGLVVVVAGLLQPGHQ